MKKLTATITAAVLVFGLSANSFAAKEKFERTKPHVNVGTIGQVEQGGAATTIKTTQTRSTQAE